MLLHTKDERRKSLASKTRAQNQGKGDRLSPALEAWLGRSSADHRQVLRGLAALSDHLEVAPVSLQPGLKRLAKPWRTLLSFRAVVRPSGVVFLGATKVVSWTGLMRQRPHWTGYGTYKPVSGEGVDRFIVWDHIPTVELDCAPWTFTGGVQAPFVTVDWRYLTPWGWNIAPMCRR